MIQGKFKIKNIYDTLIWLLLIWCVFQDFVLSFFFKVTNNVLLTKIIFYSKDVLTFSLFISALSYLKISKKIAGCFFAYYCIVIIQFIVTLIKYYDNYSMASVLSSIRGLILLLTMMVIGYAIRNKEIFIQNIKKYYSFLVVIAFIGIIEYVADKAIGTKSFWMDFLKCRKFS